MCVIYETKERYIVGSGGDEPCTDNKRVLLPYICTRIHTHTCILTRQFFFGVRAVGEGDATKRIFYYYSQYIKGELELQAPNASDHVSCKGIFTLSPAFPSDQNIMAVHTHTHHR
jgi:hypothetical protein